VQVLRLTKHHFHELTRASTKFRTAVENAAKRDQAMCDRIAKNMATKKKMKGTMAEEKKEAPGPSIIPPSLVKAAVLLMGKRYAPTWAAGPISPRLNTSRRGGMASPR
jgi:hypothetical protein